MIPSTVAAEYDEAMKVANAMTKYGGHFVRNLGEALMIADPINRARIREAFPEYWRNYLRMANSGLNAGRRAD